jgi:triosephosphate isomerase
MLIVANWKAYVQSSEKAKKLFAGAKRLTTQSNTTIVLAPPAPYLGMLAMGNRSKVAIASQDLSLSTGGAATGEITAALLSDIGVTYSIIGHSERRAMGETDAVVSEKVLHAFANKIIPIVCVGERDRDADAKYLTMLRAQLHAVFDPLTPKQRMQVVVAYEPIWALGKPANEAITPDDLTEMVLYLRKVVGAYVPGRGVEKVQILYGGSVEPGNVRTLFDGSGIDGVLVGRASVDTDSFEALVKALKL